MSEDEKGYTKWQIMEVVKLEIQQCFCVNVKKRTTEWLLFTFSHKRTLGRTPNLLGFLTFAGKSKAFLKVTSSSGPFLQCTVLCTYIHTHTVKYLARHANCVLPFPSSVSWSWAPVKYLWQQGYRTACPLNAGPHSTHSLSVGWGLGHLEGSVRCS